MISDVTVMSQYGAQIRAGRLERVMPIIISILQRLTTTPHPASVSLSGIFDMEALSHHLTILSVCFCSVFKGKGAICFNLYLNGVNSPAI